MWNVPKGYKLFSAKSKKEAIQKMKKKYSNKYTFAYTEVPAGNWMSKDYYAGRGYYIFKPKR